MLPTTWVPSGADREDIRLAFWDNDGGFPRGREYLLARIRPDGSSSRCRSVKFMRSSVFDNDAHDCAENQTEICIFLKFVLFLPAWIRCGRRRWDTPSTMTATKPCSSLNFAYGILSPLQFRPCQEPKHEYRDSFFE